MYHLIPPTNHLNQHDTPPRKSLKRRASSLIESLTTTFSHSGISSNSNLSNLSKQTPIIITTPDLKIHTKIELNQLSIHTQKNLNHRHHHHQRQKVKSSKLKSSHQEDRLDSNSSIPTHSKSNLFQDFLNLNSNHKKYQKEKQIKSLRTSQSKSYQNQSKHPYQSTSKQHQYHYSKSRLVDQSLTMRSKGITISSLEQVMMNHFGSVDHSNSSHLSLYENSGSGLNFNQLIENQKENQNSDQMVIDEVDDPLGLFSPTGRVPIKRSFNPSSQKPIGLKVKNQTSTLTPLSILSPNPLIQSFSESFNKPNQTSQHIGKNEIKVEESNKTPNLSQSTGSNSISSFYSLDSSLNQSSSQPIQTQSERRLQMTFQNSLVNFNSQSQSISPIERFNIHHHQAHQNPMIKPDELGSVWSIVNSSNSNSKLKKLTLSNLIEKDSDDDDDHHHHHQFTNFSTHHPQLNSLRKKLSQGFKDSLPKRFKKV
ncbi:hypothetical protein DFH28DRAFT_1156781 [Melampsora americana]|nr:hypothetical protein DFH28DRAFT_1156781 [Melampsora americana]